MIHWSHRRLVDRYFAGDRDVRRAAAVRARVERCARCRDRYRRHMVAEAALPDGEAHQIERLWQGIQRETSAAVRGPAAVAAPRARGRLVLVGALATLAVFVGVRGALGPSEPVQRGATPAVAAPELHVFRSVGAHRAEPLGGGAGSIQARDGLLFAYSNGDPTLDHLMVFAVDSRYGVHWYYPAYQRAGEDPAAIPILRGTAGAELGEEIRHDLPPGPVRVYAIFMPDARRVLEVEAMLRRLVEEPRRSATEEVRLPIPGAVQQSELLEVRP